MKALISALLALPMMAVPVLAQSSISRAQTYDVIESYVAYIGENDLYNSSGTRLRQPWQIIRQDRANFHLFGLRDRGDDSDSFFASEGNRQVLERMLRNGSISGSAGRMVVQGGVFIQVDIYGAGNTGEWIEVFVLN